MRLRTNDIQGESLAIIARELCEVVREIENGSEWVVELVRHAGHQTPERLRTLRFGKAALELQAIDLERFGLGNVSPQADHTHHLAPHIPHWGKECPVASLDFIGVGTAGELELRVLPRERLVKPPLQRLREPRSHELATRLPQQRVASHPRPVHPRPRDRGHTPIAVDREEPEIERVQHQAEPCIGEA